MKHLYKIIISAFTLLMIFPVKGFSVETNQLQQFPVFNSIDDEPEITIVRYYPNPVIDKIKIDVRVKDAGSLIVDIYDVAGNKVVEKKMNLFFSGLNTINIDFSELHSGIYILKAAKDSKAVSVRIKKQ